MTDIKFRARDIDTNKWRYGQYIHLHRTTHCFKEDNDADKDNDIHQIVFEEMTDWDLPNRHLRADIDVNTLCQFTGIYDNNHVEIYEGDIVSFFGMKGEIVFDKGAFGIYSHNINWEKIDENILFYTSCNNPLEACMCDTFISLWELYWNFNELDNCIDFVKIIGNKYDNPKLLEEI